MLSRALRARGRRDRRAASATRRRDRAARARGRRAEPRVALEYVEVRDAHELTPMTTIDGSVLIAVAARVGETRLIDNVVVRVDDSGVTADLGVVDADASVTPVGSTTPV